MYRILHCAFCTATEPPTVSMKSISEDLYKEVKLKRLVEKFKKASDINRFRKETVIYEKTVRRLAGAKRFRWIRDILEHQKQYSDISKEDFSARLISLYGKSGMAKHARMVFDEMPQRKCNRTVLSFNALLAAYLHSRKFNVVDELFKTLPTQLSIEPDLVSYNTLVKAFCKKGSFDSALSVLKEMEEKGVNPDSITFNTLLDGLYSKGSVEDGEKVWGQMDAKNVTPDLRSYSSKLVRLVKENNMDEVVEFFGEIKKLSVKPDVNALINTAIKSSVNDGNLEWAKTWFDVIVNIDFYRHRKTYFILIRFLFGVDPDFNAVANAAIKSCVNNGNLEKVMEWFDIILKYDYDYSNVVPFLREKGDSKTAMMLCEEFFQKRGRVDVSLLQLVVDKLVDEGMISKAKEMVKKVKSRFNYRLNLPEAE
ncbi:pentatricopeptide repeat-containing protein At1g55890, mitochondrial-like [Vigna radiata var. radiata]|uniref:Pentatricopeptide repeat-containing protein At1g55890, mitochondrial-like n=1 Tax=Vigna radiata var. radiata TaxID=3916 RepID=A0A1S3UXC0_VIGRR|nr:pentatricopeptide repeat-containing protein At1g55890, mitochondrial-like [Vigna radiata var. radiata]